MKKIRFFPKTFKILTSIILVISLTASLCAASKKSKKSKKTTETEETTASTDEKVSIPIPESAKKRTYFSSIDESIVNLVEDGTPSSLQNAMSQIRKNESDYTDTEKVLISIAADLMNILWTSQKVSWTTPEVTVENPYTSAIQSARKGIFDSSTGNNDFFTNLLPALVLFFPSASPADYYDSVETALLAAEKLNSKSVLPEYLLGVLYEKEQKYELSAEKYKIVYGRISNVLEVSLSYARILTQVNQSEAAYKILCQLNEKDPSNLQILRQCAYTTFAMKDYTAAEEFVAKVLQQTPNDLEFVLFRAKILVNKNDYIHAVTLLDMYERQNDTSLDYLLLRAKVQLDWSKNTNAAAETVEKTLQLYPLNSEGLMLAARISSITDSPVAGKYADELAALVLELSPDNREARVYALDGLMKRENWESAYEISKELLDFKNPDSHIVLCHVTNCIKTDRKEEALQTADQAYSLNSTDETICQAYIYAYSNAGQRDDAIEKINSMMTEASSKLKSYLYYSRSFLQLTDDLILADLRSSLIANPRNSDALLRLYGIYYAKEDYRKAQYYLRQVVAINPNDSSVKKLNDALTQLIK